MIPTFSSISSYSSSTLQLKNFSLVLKRPQVMGILNLSADSFSASGRFLKSNEAIEYGLRMVEEGAAIIDVGAEPTNPKSKNIVSLQQELSRVVPVVEKLRHYTNVPISVDTSKPEVMEAVITAGADMINDVRALRVPGTLEIVAKHTVGICLMHMPHPGEQLKSLPFSSGTTNIMKEILTFLQTRVDACLSAGISRQRIVVDPGIGTGSFGKTLQQNLFILNHLNELFSLQLPILIGVSRKTFIGEYLNLPESQRLNGSLSAAVIAVLKGALLIRVHDVRASVEAISMAMAIIEEQGELLGT